MKSWSLFLLLIIAAVGCSKEDDADIQDSLVSRAWEAKKIDTDTYKGEAPNRDLILSFSDLGHYALELEVNGCGGTYGLSGENGVYFNGNYCTKAGGDSEFSEQLKKLISNMRSYEIKRSKLTLTGTQGTIEFRVR
jgi:hypothetical protein